MDKATRQEKILELIYSRNITTQEDLVKALAEEGIEVAQATISRDIKELNILKVNLRDGRQKFVALRPQSESGTRRLLKVFSEAVRSSSLAGNILVIHTLAGMAPACASAVDALCIPAVAGCIAGDDTIFVAIKSGSDVLRVEEEIMQFATYVEEDNE
jgi:transcriptional regulator of arginine metabolism